MKTALFLSSLLLFSSSQLVSQTSTSSKHLSSYQTQLLSGDTAVVNKNIETAKNYISKGDYEQADIYIKLARKQSKAINYNLALTRTYYMEANILSRKGQYTEANLLADSALSVAKK